MEIKLEKFIQMTLLNIYHIIIHIKNFFFVSLKIQDENSSFVFLSVFESKEPFKFLDLVFLKLIDVESILIYYKEFLEEISALESISSSYFLL